MRFDFVLIDLTTKATPVHMRPAPAFEALIDAWERQVCGEYADAWGLQLLSFRIGKRPEDREAHEIAINFRDVIPEAPGALAYHTITNGVPDIEIGVDLFTSLLDGQDSVSCGGSHEILETLLNPGANGWKDRDDSSGEMNAEEACDYVQDTGYPADNGAWLSNFILPTFFLPGSAGPWDYLGVMKTQEDVSHGYGILAAAPTVTTEATITKIEGAARRRAYITHTGSLTLAQARRKAHPYSRAHRRGITFAKEG